MRAWPGPAPAFRLADLKGIQGGLELRGAHTTIVHFFATWCEPCREELPALSRLARRAGADVRVVAISVAEPEMRVRRFMSVDKPDFPVLLDADRAAARAWGVTVLPTSFVLDEAQQPILAAEESVNWDAIEPSELRKQENRSASAQ